MAAHRTQVVATAQPVTRGAPAPSSGAPDDIWSQRWRRRWPRWWPWLIGIAAGIVTLGPALAPGSVFSLDLILTPEIPVPHGVWGLGPELPRRLPLMLPAAWLSPIIPGWLSGKLMIVGSIAFAFVGVFRMVRFESRIAAVGAGLLYAVNPFMLTRVAAGHLALVVAMAALPWCLPTLLRPGDRPYRTFLCCFALAFTGNYGGMISAFLIVAGLLNTRGRNVVKVLGVWFVAQLPWLLPGLFVLNDGGAITDGSAFTTIGRGVLGKAQVLAGHGFWNYTFQAGFTGIDLGEQLPVALTAIALLVLAIIGARDLPEEWRWAAAALAGLGAFIAIVSSFEFDANPYFALTRNPLGANLRESLRALPLYLVWMAPASAFGAVRVGRAVGTWISARSGSRTDAVEHAASYVFRAVPLGIALFLAAPGLWGVSGHLQSTDLPDGWQQIRARVQEEPGTVVALPWHAYMRYELGGTHLIINPWPFYLGGDVLICSDTERKTKCGAEDGNSERADPREVTVGRLVGDAKENRPIGDRLASIGVRWIVLSHVEDWDELRSIERDAGLERVVAAPTVDLYRVRSWRGDVVEDGGRVVGSSSFIDPVAATDASGAATFARAASPGWRRGLAATESSTDGLVRLPEGKGPVWYWPAVVVVMAYVGCGLFLVLAIRAEWRIARNEPPEARREPRPQSGVKPSRRLP